MTIYVELIFISNFAINAVIVFYTSMALKLKTKPARIAFSSGFGAVFSAIYPFAVSFAIYIRIFLALLYPILIKKPSKFKEYLNILLVFLGISVALAGAVLILNGFSADNLTFSPITYGMFPVLISVSAILFGFSFKKVAKDGIKIRNKNSNIYRAILANVNNERQLSAFYDSGNRVFGEKGEPVVFINPTIYNELMPAGQVPLQIKTVGGHSQVMVTDVVLTVYFENGTNKIYMAKAAAAKTPFDGYQVLLNAEMC